MVIASVSGAPCGERARASCARSSPARSATSSGIVDALMSICCGIGLVGEVDGGDLRLLKGELEEAQHLLRVLRGASSRR